MAPLLLPWVVAAAPPPGDTRKAARLAPLFLDDPLLPSFFLGRSSVGAATPAFLGCCGVWPCGLGGILDATDREGNAAPFFGVGLFFVSPPGERDRAKDLPHDDVGGRE